MKRILTLITALLLAPQAALHAADTAKPNILADDLRYGDVRCYNADAKAPTPHGGGSPDKHPAELYDLRTDPGELRNLAASKEHAATRADLEKQLAALLASEGLTPDKDKMPLDEGIKSQLPDQKIR